MTDLATSRVDLISVCTMMNHCTYLILEPHPKNVIITLHFKETIRIPETPPAREAPDAL